MEKNTDTLTVEHDAGAHQFHAMVDGMVSVLQYQLERGTMVILSTEVPPPLRHRGIAGKITRAALDHARANQLRVDPVCPYVADWIDRNPEYRALVRGE